MFGGSFARGGQLRQTDEGDVMGMNLSENTSDSSPVSKSISCFSWTTATGFEPHSKMSEINALTEDQEGDISNLDNVRRNSLGSTLEDVSLPRKVNISSFRSGPGLGITSQKTRRGGGARFSNKPNRKEDKHVGKGVGRNSVPKLCSEPAPCNQIPEPFSSRCSDYPYPPQVVERHGRQLDPYAEQLLPSYFSLPREHGSVATPPPGYHRNHYSPHMAAASPFPEACSLGPPSPPPVYHHSQRNPPLPPSPHMTEACSLGSPSISQRYHRNHLPPTPPHLQQEFSDYHLPPHPMPQNVPPYRRTASNYAGSGMAGGHKYPNPEQFSWLGNYAGPANDRSIPCDLSGRAPTTQHRVPSTTQGTVAGGRTSVMLRNIPEVYMRDQLAALLDSGGLARSYDFLYLPMNFRSGAPIGYAIVNFVSPGHAQHCFDIFQGFRDWGVPTAKVCEPTWSEGSQGLTEHVQRYRNCPLMHESVPDNYKPAIYSNGMRVPFPEPTKPIRKPRLRKVDGDAVEDCVVDDYNGRKAFGVHDQRFDTPIQNQSQDQRFDAFIPNPRLERYS